MTIRADSLIFQKQMYNFNKEEFKDILQKTKSIILYKKIPADTITPVLASLKISQNFPEENNYNFLLESAEKGNNKGRFSVIGLMPDLVWKCQNEESFINKNFEKNPQNFVKENGHPIANLRQLINSSKIEWSNLKYASGALPEVCGGIFGYMSYDMVRLMEKMPNKNLQDDLKIPDSIFIRPQILIIFDNLFDCALICAPVFKDKNPIPPDNEMFEYYYNLFEKSFGKNGMGESGPGLVDDHDSMKEGSENWDKVIDSLNSGMTEEEKESLKSTIEKHFQSEPEQKNKTEDKKAGLGTGGQWTFAGTSHVQKKAKWETIIKKWSKKYLNDKEKDQEQGEQ
jgi:hypothetical protein